MFQFHTAGIPYRRRSLEMVFGCPSETPLGTDEARHARNRTARAWLTPGGNALKTHKT
jgi:hypothetical protein